MPNPRPRPVTPVKLISFSGGGWNSHSNLAGATAASMDLLQQQGQERSVTSLFSDYDNVSGNSGGTWFLSHLGFSPDYLDSLQNRNRADSYKSNGFIGQVQRVFPEAPVPYSANGQLARNWVLNNFDGTGKPDWNKLVHDLVYDPILNKEDWGRVKLHKNDITRMPFEGDKLADWMTGKHLTYASAFAKRKNNSENYLSINQLPISNIGPDGRIQYGNYAYSGFVGMAGGDASTIQGVNHYPLAFEIKKADPEAGITSKSTYRIPNGYDYSSNSARTSTLHFSHDGGQSGRSPWGNRPMVQATKSVDLISTGDARQLMASQPSVGSSAAAAFKANPDFYGLVPSQIKGNRKLAPSISFGSIEAPQLQIGNEYEYNPSKDELQSYLDIANDRFTRLGDGGFVDNTSLAFNLSSAVHQGHLDNDNRLTRYTPPQDNQPRFEATIFVNNTDNPDSDWMTFRGDSNVKLPSDILGLFGVFKNSDKNTGDLVYNTDTEFGYLTNGLWQPSQQIFRKDNLTGSSFGEVGLSDPLWSYQGANTGDKPVELKYWKIDVETVDNATYNIVGGVKGRLRIFLSSNPESNAMPWKGSIHSEYGQNYDTWRNAITSFDETIGGTFI